MNLEKPDCYCVCHSPLSSRAFCEYCNGMYLKGLQDATPPSIQNVAYEMYGEMLTDKQLEYIEAVMGNNIVIMPRIAGKTVAIKVLQEYVKRGIHGWPTKQKK